MEPIYSDLGDDPDLAELVDLFVAEIPDRVAGFHDALANADWDRLKLLVHQLKGAAGGYGFHALTEPAASVEEAINLSAPRDQLERSLECLCNLCLSIRTGSPSGG